MILFLLFLALSPLARAGEPFSVDGFTHWEEQGGYILSGETLTSRRVGMADAHTGSLLWGDYRLEMTIKAREYGSEHSGARIFFRLIGGWEGYGISIGSTGTGLSRFDGGYDRSHFMGSSPKGLAPGQSATFAIEVRGNKIDVYRNGELIISAMDPEDRYPYGYIGVRSELSDLQFSGFHAQGTQITDPELRQRALRNFGPPVQIPPGEFLKASDPRTGGARDILLIYEQAGNMTWHSFDALPYVAYLDNQLKPQDWFFDTFMFVAGYAPEGRHFATGQAAIMEDWIWWLDRIFHHRTGITAFNRAVRTVGEQLGDDEYKAKIIIMIPYPFGEEAWVLDGEELLLSPQRVRKSQAAADRLKVVMWYIDEVLRRWESAAYDRLELIGFYWNNEELCPSGVDHLYMPQVGQEIRRLGYRFSWIPWYKAPGYTDWEKVGFDAVMMQPNYMFSSRVSRSRFEQTVAEARRLGLGIEMEASLDILKDQAGRERYLDYLRAGVEYGFSGDVLRGWYQDVTALGQAAIDSDPEVRRIYDLTYQFVKGQFNEGF